MRVGVLSVVLVVLMAGTAGCGGGGKKSAAGTTTTATATTSSGSTSTSVSPSFATSKNCAQLAALAARVAKALQPAGGDAKTAIANEAKALQAMASAAPTEIRGDFETFAKAFNTYVQAIAKLDLKPGTTPTAAQLAQLATAAKALSAPDLTTAEQHLSAWAQKNCGGVTTTTG